ncbi:hypothetical protein D1013_16765 [Euzebyella marina]|uniref:YtxH domain-containing protein n=1 Tax=Euzebyella marina TaxID=1761453 RepID=A0A3G2L9N4_9FLAO|nr:MULTISPECIES: hypothetical protein [Bacteroidota]AYN68911.1 hypothetical protein D1013_16765 [Euzebyella marina]MAU72009.1 hypothetical protein [Pseudozobellia sp.]MBC6998129.1 hypothetical protein [Cytophaga sp. FL35]MBG47832.1 hypothetical protein [Pseudozobellia sp.]
MRKSVYYFMTLCALVFSLSAFNSCREEKSTGEKIEDTMDEVGDDIEEGAEDVQDEVEDAVDDN